MEKKLIYFVPYAHLDTQWRWEYPITIKKYVKSTIDDNIALLEKYPQYEFNFTGAIRYRMMKEYYPEGFEKVKKYVKEGRWHLAGTCLEETDALVPGVESLIRNILYGYNWQMREFGKSGKDYMLPDCFGFPRNFPSVLKHCGIVGFSAQKLTWGSAVGIPFEIGRWRGDDGSELICALNPGEYVGRLKTIVDKDKNRLKKLYSLGGKNGVWKSFQYYGTGDIGGAPDEKSVVNFIKSAEYYDKNGGGIKIAQGAADEFFKGLTEEEVAKLDVYEGDLLLVKHSAGSLTSQANMKRFNRRNEQLAIAAEYISLVARNVARAEYPKERIEKNWQRIIGNQMHDILPGTCTPTAYEYSYNDEILAMKEWAQIIEDGLTRIAPHIKGGGDILIFNPCECARNTVSEIVVDNLEKGKNYALKDCDGNIYPAQIKDGNILAVQPFMNAFEIKKFELVVADKAETDLSLKITDTDYILENRFLQVKVNFDGEIYSVVNKENGEQILAKPLSYHLMKERPAQYPAWNMDWKDRKKSPYKILSKVDVKVVEDGPVRKTLEITVRTKKSVLVKELSLSKDCKTVDFVEKIDWRDSGFSLKLNLQTTYDNPKAVYNWESCVAERGVNNSSRYEVPSRYWADIKNGGCGVAILEDCKYGYDRPNASCLRMTLLYTPKSLASAGFLDQRAQDFGRHTIKYSIYPHTADEVDMRAKILNRPNRIYRAKCAEGGCADTELISFDGEKARLLALKQAESGEGIILRLYGRQGKEYKGKVRVKFGADKVYEVNGLEEIIREIPLDGGAFEIDINAGSVHSYLIKTNFVTDVPDQKNIVLPLNCGIIGNILPEELIPGTIVSGNVRFAIKKGGSDCVRCGGQTIDIGGEYKNVSMLVFADEKTTFGIGMVKDGGKTTVTRTVASSTEFIGQYDTRVWKRTPGHAAEYKRDYVWRNKCVGVKEGYVNGDKVAYYTTHTHKRGSDVYYRYGYIYQIDLVTDGADKLILPDNADIKILAATAYNGDCRIADITRKADRYEI